MTEELKRTNMIKRLNLNEEHIKLIPFIFLQESDNETVFIEKRHMFSLGSHLLEDLAMILGYNDKAIPNTENDAEGRAYPDDVEEQMLSVYNYLKDNLYYLESLIHQFSVNGGITPGSYKCKANELIWERE